MRPSLSSIAAVLSLLMVVAAALVVAAIATPWLFWWLEGAYQFPFHRVFNRIAMLVFVAGACILLFKLRLNSQAHLGYDATLRRFMALFFAGFAGGMLTMSVVGMTLLALEARLIRPELDAAIVLLALPYALLSGIAVAFVEETIFRGAMYSAARRNSSAVAATILVSLIYASVHFLGEKTRIASEDVSAFSGLFFLSHFFAKFSRPLEILDAFVALLLVGVLLAAVREKFGNIAPGAGLHAGFVATIVLLKKISTPAYDSRFGILINRIDGVVGWLVACAATLAIAYVWYGLPTTVGAMRRDSNQ